MELTGGIEVRITGGTPLEVLARITAWGLRCSSEPRVYALATQLMELENKLNAYDKEGNPAPGALPVPAPAPTNPPADPPGPAAGETGPSAAPSEETATPKTEVPAPVPAPSATDKVPSQDDVTDKGREAAKKYGAAAIKPILREFGVVRLSELAEKDRAAFLARLESLGDGNA